MKKNSDKKISDSALVKTWFEALPWLKNSFEQDRIKKVVKREFEPEHLLISSEYNPLPLEKNVKPDKQVMFFATDGRRIGQLGVKIEPRKEVTRGCFVLGFRKEIVPEHPVFFTETLARAIKRLNCTENIRYIVGVFNQEEPTRLIITVLSSSFNLEYWTTALQQELREEKSRINEELRLARERVAEELSGS